MILRSKLCFIAGAAGGAAFALLSTPSSINAFTADSFFATSATTSRRRAVDTSVTSLNNNNGPGVQQPQQYFDANGNPVAMPMVYDANGNLVPFNPTPLPPPPPAAQQQPAIQQQPQLDIIEPPLPSKTKKATDSPRPVGFNSDAYTMSNTADVYFAQLKQDSKVRKIARMRGDTETANKVFDDESVVQIGESWNENPYTKEQNTAEARAEIEGTVRLQVQDSGNSNHAGQAISYRQKLAEMQSKRAGRAGSVAPPAVVEPEPKVVEQPPSQPEMTMPPPVVNVAQQQNVNVVQSAPSAPVAETVTNAPDPIAGSVASVEAVLQRYENAPPQEREGMVAELREAMMAASSASAEAALATPPAAATVAETPPVPQIQQQEPPMEPTMGFPTEYAVTKPEEEAVPAPTGSYEDLALAATTLDATTVSSLISSGLEMDETTTDAAFRAIVNAVDRAEALDQPLSGDIPVMLHHVFDADMNHLLTREKETMNVTCMMPEQAGANRIGMNYIFDDSAHKDLPLEEGRRCEGGTCCDKCSRNIFPTFASQAETSFDTYPELTGLTFNDLADVSAATILQFTRLIERVRRTIAHEYGLPLKTILPLQAYSRKYVAGSIQQGGGGGEGDFVTLHTDEATHDGYHYSCVLYLSTQGEDFEGGNFVFNDPDPNAKKTKNAYFDPDDPDAKIEKVSSFDEDDDYDEVEYATLAEEIRKAGRVFTPYGPSRGAAVIFSSGWENMHEVEQITAGTRYCVPCFFTTCPVPDAAYDQMVQGKPKTNEDIADDWLHLLLAHRKEDAHESLGRVKELLMKWHYICAPLSEH